MQRTGIQRFDVLIGKTCLFFSAIWLQGDKCAFARVQRIRESVAFALFNQFVQVPICSTVLI